MNPQRLTDPLDHRATLSPARSEPVTGHDWEVDSRNPPESPRFNNDALIGRVHRAILGTGRGSLQRVTVLADAGYVVLCGRVPTYYMKQLAQQTAMSVPGVDRIDNQLVVK